MQIRNIAIIAHVDHGKTTLVDFLLKQSHTFRENEAEMQQTTILDSNPLERERGITILAKNTAVVYNDTKINIVDTPGHADFSGEVERTLNMADGALLIIDAQEGPMPQTRFVLKKALALGLKIIVVINKVDKPLADVEQTLSRTHDLFLELATHEDQLEFPTVYAIGREGKAAMTLEGVASATDLTCLFDTILSYIPAPEVENGPFRLLVTSLDYDNHKGKHIIGRLHGGNMKKGQSAVLLRENNEKVTGKIETVSVSKGLKKEEVEEATCGDIVDITGFDKVTIGDTLADPSRQEAFPRISVEEPTIKISMGPNTSPFAGKEGKFTTSRQIEERLNKELETNVSLHVERAGDRYMLSGRGELHLAVLIETMRREGYECEVGKPEVIIKTIDGVKCEPFEMVTIDVPDEYVGAVTQEMGMRKGEMRDMVADGKGSTRLEYHIASKNLLGIRSILLTNSKGTALLSTLFDSFAPLTPALEKMRNGALVASEPGSALAYGLETLQERGIAFIGPGTEVYEGMIVGMNSRKDDIDVNVTKGKKLTNMRSANADMSTILTPPLEMSLEQFLDFLEADELLEVTPKSLRARKRYLTKVDRIRATRG